ncbi:Bro-N domain-containing protein, partial [Paenibacillus larvae]
MNQLQVFNFTGKDVRMIMKGGQPWFVLKDVCSILELSNPRMVKERLSDDVSSTYSIPDSLGRLQPTTIINEDGLYDVILESRKSEAREFRKWVTRDVLPSIRKTGMYAA